MTDAVAAERRPEDGVTRGVLVGVLGTVAAANVARSLVVPAEAHFAFNVAVAAAVVGLGTRARLTRTELGLGRDAAPAGLRLGGLTLAATVGVVAVAAAIPATRGAFDGQADLSGAALAGRVLVIIPIGTVVVEELIFRGVLQGLLGRLLAPAATLGVGAAIFGLWHVLPAWRADGPAVAAGTLVTTTVAGLGFGWLRARSGSLLAPALAHLGTNTVPFVAAWLLGR